MTFLRKLFRGNEGDASSTTPAHTPDVPPEGAATAVPSTGVRAAASDDAAWWDTTAPLGDAVPPASQSHDETPPTAMGAMNPEDVRKRLAASVAPSSPHLAPPSKVVTEPMDVTHQLDDDEAPTLSAHQSVQGLSAMAARDIGRVRENNQDSVFTMITTLPREGTDLSVGLFIVADGMGGHQGGEVASRLAVRTVVHQILSQLVLPALDDTMSTSLQPLMVSAVQAANQAIWDTAQAMGTDMGTTCTAVLLVGHGLYIAHVGDSRAYLYEPGGLRQITTDHSTVGRLIQLGQLDPSEAREHPLRNQLYRTVGQQPQVMVDFIYQPVGVSSHLLLCSDGLWGMVEDSLLAQALGRSPWPQDTCNELIALANLAGGEDNISAVVVSLPMAER